VKPDFKANIGHRSQAPTNDTDEDMQHAGPAGQLSSRRGNYENGFAVDRRMRLARSQARAATPFVGRGKRSSARRLMGYEDP
jgi:hypothetical protein